LSGWPSLASSGGSAGVSKRQPSHTGLSTSPPSNMTHTPAPGGGTMYTPIGPGGPDSGAQGSTQVVGTKPATSATVSISRARNSGSLLNATVPRYSPGNLPVIPVPSESAR